MASARSVAVTVCLACTAVVVLTGCSDTRPTERPYRVAVEFSVADPQFSRTMSSLLGPPLVPGNQAVTLVNGDRIFPAMLDAVRSAERTVCFETFIYWSGEVGEDFATALSDAAGRGVEVRVIIDDYGSGRIGRDQLKRMRDAGVKVVKYHPLRWHSFIDTKRMENRTHRKLLVVDGKVGFTGGVGVADEWLGDADSSKHWRDTHYEVRGPVVAQLQAAFLDNWMETTGEVLTGDDYFPPTDDAGEQWAQVFRSSPAGGSESMQLMYLLSIAAARKNVRLGTPYFVPDRITTRALLDARERGVSVQIIVPGSKIDVPVVRQASRARWGELLKAGVEIWEYQPTMYHCKLMVIDDRWASIGSANLDARSFRMNDEVNVNVLDEAFAAEQVRTFEDDLKRCKRITYEQWRRRPLLTKMAESFASAFGWLM